MASISTDKSGNRVLRFVDASGKRKAIYLGDMPKKQCEQIRGHVEKLVSASISRCSVADETSRWVAELEEVLRKKLSQVGLIAARESMSLEGFIKAYIQRRKDVKANTLISWRRTLRYLLLKFNGNRLLQSFTKADCKDFRQHMVSLGYAEATIRRTCGVARQFFEDAKERGLIGGNPFKTRDVPVSSVTDKNRQAYITHETAQAVLEKCPDLQWQLLFALSRYAGLRCPSEHLSLRWDDVQWNQNRMTVHSPKTEHHEGGAMRVVPIFPELRPYLEAAFEVRGDAEFVITRYRDTNANLRTQLLRIIKRAGVKAWPKLFHNLRASCETDLAKVHPIKAVCDWIGNSVAVAQKHYLQTTEADFEKASEIYCQNPCQTMAEIGGLERTPVSRNVVNHWVSSDPPSRRVGVTGIEPVTPSV